MPFLVRNAEISDLPFLCKLARKEPLLSLPPDPADLTRIILKSLESFSSPAPPEDATYVFVLEDLTTFEIIGESLVYGKYASPQHPYCYFNILEKTYADSDLDKTMTHKVLRLELDPEPFSMTGGLVLDSRYRGHSDKLGSVIALTRFTYMGMFPERFQTMVLSEVAEPRDENGGDPFWDAVGKKLTGLSFEEHIECVRQKNFRSINKLFPPNDIFCCFLSPDLWPSKNRIRQDVGHFACHIIEKIGFRYLNRAHLNGGPIFGAQLSNISIVRNGALYRADISENFRMNCSAFIGSMNENKFRGGKFSCSIESQTVFLPKTVFHSLALRKGQKVFVSLV